MVTTVCPKWPLIKHLLERKMPESEILKLTRTTARGFLSRNPNPKYKYIEDPADVVSSTYNNQFSQFNVKYNELNLTVSPIFGRFSGERVVFHYNWDTVDVTVENNLVYVMFLREGTSPENFVRFCLNFIYSSGPENILRKHEIIDGKVTVKSNVDHAPASLSVQCLRSVAVNMSSMPRSELQYLPNHYQEQFRPESFIQVKFNLWPRHIRGESTILAVKKDMIISEVLLLLRQKLKLGSDLKVDVFKNCIHIEDDDVLQTEDEDYDCVITSCKPRTNILCLAGNLKRDLPTATMKDVIITSLVGNQMKEVQINLSLPLKFLDRQLRQTFRLKPWSFLALHLPGEEHNIFKVGRMIYTSYEEEYAKFLISNGKRNFPKSDKGVETLPIKDMYNECSSYKKSLRSLGFHPGTVLEVFEITGPTIPVMYSGAVTKAQVIDVNPDWSLQTFLYYVRVNTAQASKIESIDYVSDCNEGKVADLLNMMKNLWNRPDDGSRLEYLRLRS